VERRSSDKTLHYLVITFIVTILLSTFVMLYFSTKSNTDQLRIDELERKMTLLVKESNRESEDRYLRIQSNVDSYQLTSERRSQLILDKIDRLQDELQKNKSK
jgi:hypothetical protein